MENASDAIIMASSVFLLILALTISISSLTSFREQVTDITQARDQIQETVVDDEYLNYIKSSNTDVRTVGIETVMSAIRRIQKEQFTIYICLNGTNIPESIPTVTIDEDVKYRDPRKDRDVTIINKGQELIRLTLRNSGMKDINTDEYKEIYELLLKDGNNSREFKEYIGMYKLEQEGVLEDERITNKVLTYVEQ